HIGPKHTKRVFKTADASKTSWQSAAGAPGCFARRLGSGAACATCLAECDIDEPCASAPCAGKLRIVQILSACKKLQKDAPRGGENTHTHTLSHSVKHTHTLCKTHTHTHTHTHSL